MMIEKFDDQNGFCMADCMDKINEVINAVNNQQIQLNNHECRLLDLHRRITALDDPTYHEEPDDPYAEQRKWIGKICEFWDNDDTQQLSYGVLTKIDTETGFGVQYCCNDEYDYDACEPVKPDDDIIYKGGDNE